jgi:hypothetical protein
MTQAESPFSRAVIAGLVGPLGAYGFELRECSESNAGAEAVVGNDHLLFRIRLDRLEGELAITVGLIGRPERDLDRLIDPAQLKGLKTRRLPRSASAGFIEAQLRRLSEGLLLQVPEALADNEAASQLLSE